MDPSTVPPDSPNNAAVPAPPPRLLAQYRVRDNRVVIKLPNAAWPGCLAVWFMCVLALFGFMAYVFIDTHYNWAPPAIFGGIGSLILAAFYAAAAPEIVTLEVDPSRLSIIEGGLILSKRKEIPAAEISVIQYNEGAFAIKYGDTSFALGGKISGPELDWIRMILCRVLNKPQERLGPAPAVPRRPVKGVRR